MTMKRLPDPERRIFPALLNQTEKQMLTYLSTESGLSMSGVVRQLILRETATRQLGSRPAQQEPTTR